MKKMRWTDLAFKKAVAVLLGAAFTSSALAANPNFSKHFKNKDGCFVLYDMKTKRTAVTFNEKRCAERFVACSTFKVPLAVMAFDKGILKDENTTMKWDGTEHEITSWNQDQTSATWMKNSVVWFSQRITPQLGLETLKDYLSKFAYGNQDMSGGLTTAWLTSGSKPSLKISANEQVRFLERLWSDALPVSKQAMALTRKLTFLETSPKGIALHGKTGSTLPTSTQMGWFIGHLQSGESEYVFALNFTEPTPKTGWTYAGMKAKSLAKEILAEMGLF